MAWARKQAPALPEKTYRPKVPHHQQAQPPNSPTTNQPSATNNQRLESTRSELSDDVFYENTTNPKVPVTLASVVPPGGGLDGGDPGAIPQRRGTPSLTVSIPHPAGSRTHIPSGDSSAIPVIVGDEEEEEFFSDVDGVSMKRGAGSTAASPSSHTSTLPRCLTKSLRSGNQSEASLSSCGSADTTSTQVVEDLKTSPALTTLRPRSGKEYQRVDRKKLAEELASVPPLSASGVPGPADKLPTAQSPSVASTSFSFDAASLLSERKSFSSAWSSGEDSPKYPPSLCSRQSSFREHHYMNLSFPRNESLAIVEATPPGSPRPHSRISNLSEAQLNYAEIDLSEMDDKRGGGRGGRGGRGHHHVRRETPPTEYAVIDMEATAAASRVGREHARHREDSLLRKESQRLHHGNERPSSAGRAPTLSSGPPPVEKKPFLSRHSSMTSKDR